MCRSGHVRRFPAVNPVAAHRWQRGTLLVIGGSAGLLHPAFLPLVWVLAQLAFADAFWSWLSPLSRAGLCFKRRFCTLNRPGGYSLLLQQWRLSLLVAFLANGAFGQWLNYPAPGTPRTRDGKPDLSAPSPRATGGKPDLSGVWQTAPAPPGENDGLLGDVSPFVVPGDDPRTFSKYFWNILADFKATEAPIRPEAAELFRKNVAGGGNNPAHCLPLGIPGACRVLAPNLAHGNHAQLSLKLFQLSELAGQRFHQSVDEYLVCCFIPEFCIWEYGVLLI